MCGILVFKSKNLNNELKNKFRSCLNSLKNRGPDDLNIVKNKNLLAGFTRLSINDIKTGSQPFVSLCGKYIIVFNGEIVNYNELGQRLNKKNIKMKYGHEAEVILNLFILYGDKCVEFLRGFFAFVIIETKTNNIHAFVDRFAIKPLYYIETNNGELKILTSDYSSLIKNEVIKKELNIQNIGDFFSFGRYFGHHVFKEVKQIGPGSILKIKGNNKHTVKYWKPFNSESKIITKNISLQNSIILLSEKLIEVANSWKLGETNISLCLSTGMDSQIINYYFNLNNIRKTNFHISERKKKFIEPGTHTIDTNLKKTQILFNDFIKESFNPYPLAHGSSTTLFELYNSISFNNFKMTFTGEGSDEIMGGYERYRRQLFLLERKKLNFTNMIMETYKRDIQATEENFNNKFAFNFKENLKTRIKKIKLNSQENINKILEFDQLTFLPAVLQRHDFIGMHYSLEVRPIFLDHELVELINQLPVDFKYNLNENKIILRKLFKLKKGYDSHKIKIGTPSIFHSMMSNKNEIKNFREAVFYGICQNFLKTEKVIKKIKSNYKKNDSIFLWRLYVLNKILYNF